MVDHFLKLRQTVNYGVAQFYFDYKEQDAQKPIQILGSLLKQLAGQISADLPVSIANLYKRFHEGKKRPTLDELYVALIGVSKSFPRVVLVFDALDECKPETRMELLPLFLRMSNDGINVFLTSRPHPEDIQDSLTDSDAVKIGLSAQAEDLMAYI